CVGGLVRIAVRPVHAVAENDQQLVASQRFRVEHGGLVAEVDRHSQIFRDVAAQAGPDIVRVVVAVADEGVGGGLVGGARQAGSESGAGQRGDCGTTGSLHRARLYRKLPEPQCSEILNVFPSGSLNQATLAPLGDVQIPDSS